MPSDFLIFFPFILFLLDVLAKDWVGSGLVESKNVDNNVIVLIVAAFDFFHPSFDLFVCTAHVVFVFQLHLSQVDFTLMIPARVVGLMMERIW